LGTGQATESTQPDLEEQLVFEKKKERKMWFLPVTGTEPVTFR